MLYKNDRGHRKAKKTIWIEKKPKLPILVACTILNKLIHKIY